MDFPFFLKAFAALFSVMSPVANIPVFLSLTAGYDPARRRAIALAVTAGTAVGGALILLGGEAALGVFGIGIDAFRLAGGLLLLLIAINMVQGAAPASHQGSREETRVYSSQEDPTFYPLTVPMLLGPGTISTLILFEDQAASAASQTALWAALAAIVAMLGVAFVGATQASRLLGRSAISILARIMGMILAGIAVEMMVSSLKTLLPGLAG